MGCWNATCNVSNLPIFYGDEIVLIPLMKVKNKTRFNTCYATDNFVPFAFPIFGKYDEYGGLEEIVPDKLNETLLRSYEYWHFRDEEYNNKKSEYIPISEKSFEQFVNDVLCCHEGVYIKMNTGLHKNDMVEINYINFVDSFIYLSYEFSSYLFCIKCKKILILSTFVQMCFLKNATFFCGSKTNKFHIDFYYILWLLSAINLDVKEIY